MATGVEDAVNLALIADNTLGGGQAGVVVRGAGLGPGYRGVGPGGPPQGHSWLTRRDAENLYLLSNTVDVNEGSGVEGDVGVEQSPLRPAIDRAEYGPVQADGEGDLVPVLGVRQHVLGADPVLGPLAQEVRVLGELTALQEPRVS